MPQNRLLLRVDDHHFDAIDPDEIFYVEAAGGDTMVRTRRKRRYRTTETLAQLAARLPPDRFIRTHRSFVVNTARVRQVRQLRTVWELKARPAGQCADPGRAFARGGGVPTSGVEAGALILDD